MELNRELSKEEIQIAKKEMYRYSPSLAIRETQEKNTLRFHPIPVSVAKKKKNDSECGDRAVGGRTPTVGCDQEPWSVGYRTQGRNC